MIIAIFWNVLIVSFMISKSILSERPNKGLKFLEGCEDNWMENSSLRTHVSWHRTLYHVQLGEYEAALTQYDDVIMPLVRKGM